MFMFMMLLNLVFLAVGIFVFKDYTLFLLIPGMIMVAWAQLNIQSTFNRWKQVGTNFTGLQMAQLILDENGIDDVSIEHVAGELTDHYDPSSKILRLSDSTYDSNSVAAVAIAAHEVGHAIQHHTNYSPLVARNNFAPVAQFASKAWIFVIFAGYFFGLSTSMGDLFLQIGIVCYGVFFLFAVVTLPVEFDASKRAVVALEQDGSLNPEELDGSRKVLNAAAMTYVAGAIMSLLQLLRLLLIFNNRD